MKVKDKPKKSSGLNDKVTDIKELEIKFKEMEENFQKYKGLLDASAKATSCLVTGGYGDRAIHKAMEYLGLATDADRVSIFEHFKDPVTGERLISQRYEWSKDSAEAQIDNPELQNLPADEIFPGWIDRNERGEATNEIVRHLEPSMKSILEPQGILSILIVPILIEGKLNGSIGFDDCHSERVWDESEIGILTAIAGTIGVAIVRKKAEEEKELIEDQLRQSQKLKAIGTLAGGISHDFNNILSAIIGYTELSLNQLPPKSKIKSNLYHILKGCNRAKKLVEQILTFSRQGEREKKPLLIIPLINEALKFLRATLPKTITIEKDFQITNSAVMADATEIYQLLMNLFTNAAQAIGEKNGEIKVSIKNLETDEISKYPDLKESDYLLLTVSDNGHGIKQEIIDRIFEPFFTTKNLGHGTGLGLSVVYGIVKDMGGNITVKSKSGEGTSFQIILPALATDEVISPEEEKPELLTGREHILFIDDEKDIINTEKKLLEDLGYKVTDANSSLKAYEIFKEKPQSFDLVITDYTMPDMTGLLLAEEILKIRSDIPVILCTGYSKSVDKEKTVKIGIDEILMKPLNIQELARSIRRVIDNKRSKPEILTGSEYILFIDDEAEEIEVNQLLLKKLGYRVTTRMSSLEALELFKKTPKRFDLVITDYIMPGINGLDLAKEILKIQPDIAIILFTGYDEQLNREEALQNGIKKVLIKPINIQKLAISIRETVDEKQSKINARIERLLKKL